MIFGQICNM